MKGVIFAREGDWSGYEIGKSENGRPNKKMEV